MTQEEIHDLLALGDEDAYIFPIEDFNNMYSAIHELAEQTAAEEYRLHAAQPIMDSTLCRNGWGRDRQGRTV